MITIRGANDPIMQQLLDSLVDFERKHPDSQVDAYRYNSVSVRMRKISQAFDGMDEVDRFNYVWQIIQGKVPVDVLADLSLLLLFTPDEVSNSIANLEFEHPVSS